MCFYVYVTHGSSYRLQDINEILLTTYYLHALSRVVGNPKMVSLYLVKIHQKLINSTTKDKI